MKIVCSSCGAKYSIADEKVEGKVFKIRCKKCSNVIMVKGTGGEDSVSDQHSGDGAAEWYVVIDGEQVGPITSMEIDSYFMAGQIDAETFVWRDGLSDWLPMRELAEFGHLIQETAGPEEKTQISSGYAGLGQPQDSHPAPVDDADETLSVAAGGSAGFGGGDPFGPGDSDSTDDFASSDTDYQGGFSAFGDEASPQSDLEYAAQDQPSEPMSGYGDSGGGFDSFESGGSAAVSAPEPASSDQGGMFASFDSGSSAGGDDDFLGFSSADSGSGPSLSSRSSGSSAGAASNGASLNGDGANNMIGQRNENSVLFSLSSLDQVQAVSSPAGGDGGAGAGPAGGSGSVGAEAGVTEGSGLIDIRSLASAHQSMKGGGQESETVDPFSGGTMAMPALMPMGSHRSNKGLIIAGIIFGVLFVGVAVAAIVVIATSSDKEPQTKVVEKVKYIEKEVAAATGGDSKAADEAAKAEQEALAAAEAKDDKAEEEDEEIAEKDSKEASKKSSRKTKTARKSQSPSKAAPTPTPPKKTTKKSGDSIDDLLKGIDKKDEKKPAPKPEPKSTAKSELSRDDVQNTVRRYSGRIATCKRTQNKNNLDGTMWVKFSIRPNGRTSNVSVLTGKFNGTDLGRCVQKAVQGMRFPATSATKNVDIAKFPFKL